MSAPKSSFARRIAFVSALSFAALSVLVLLAEWTVLVSVASASVTIDPPGTEQHSPQVVTAVYQLTSGAIWNVLIVSGVALIAISALGTLLTYRAARVSLRRVANINAQARSITATRLDKRLATEGPNDEIRDLSETINGMLERLEQSFAQEQRFAANASHELRTPLAVIQTSLEALARDMRVVDDQDLERARRNVTRMDDTIAALLDLARTSHLTPESVDDVDIDVIVEAVVEEFAEDLRAKDITVTTHFGGTAIVAGEPTLLVRAIHNIVENACKYTQRSGNVQITTARSEKGVRLVVANTGAVHTQDEARQLTEPFNRGTAARIAADGNGLGLAIVHSIANRHSGSVDIQANPDGGLTVALAVPENADGAKRKSP